VAVAVGLQGQQQ